MGNEKEYIDKINLRIHFSALQHTRTSLNKVQSLDACRENSSLQNPFVNADDLIFTVSVSEFPAGDEVNVFCFSI